MKKIAILLILMSLNDSSFAQSIADALEQNERRLLPAAVEAAFTFRSGGLTSVQQNSGWREMGTTDTDSCANAFGAVYLWEQNYENYAPAYDTMQWYIRHCYQNADAGHTWGAYNQSWDTVVWTQAGRDSIFNFVLYALGLRSDDEWFCYGVPLLVVKYSNSNGETPDFRAERAIDQFLMNNPRCVFNYRNDSIDYAGTLRAQWNLWVDTATPGDVFDSTIPTLQELGLDTLLSFASAAVYETLGPQIILDARLEGNPSNDGGLLWLSIGREAYLHINVYDLLGRQLSGAGYQGIFEEGTREVPLGMANAPTGTYYVRLQTANNETQTLKLVKE